MPMTTFQNDTGTPFFFTFQAPNRFGVIQAININGFSNANFFLHLYNASNQTTIVCAGNWYVIDGANGVAMYQPLASELSTPGTYTIYTGVILPTGPKTMQTDTLTITTVH